LSSETLLVGPEVQTCQPVRIPVFHTLFSGQTQLSGKTTALKTLATRALEHGYRVLVFDTKENEADYQGFGAEVPVVMRESTDSFVLIGLLESMFRRRLTPYYATLSRLTEAAHGFQDIIDRARELEARTRSAFLRDACRVLYDLLERLREETSKVPTARELQLPHPINRMAINEFSLEAQQLIVRNAFEDLLQSYNRRTIACLDEAFKFIPQRYSSACTQNIMRVITQGAKTGLYVWIATQFLAPTDKAPLKACAVRLLGTQDHVTEARHTLDLIPFGGYTAEDIMKLPLGHFIVTTKKFARQAYLLPLDVDEETGRKVARGETPPEAVREILEKRGKEVSEETVWKEKYEELLLKYNEAQRQLEDLLARRGGESDSISKLQEELNRAKEDLKTFDRLKAVLAEIVPRPEAGPVPEVTVAAEQPRLTVTVDWKPLQLTQDTLEGRLAIAYAEGLLGDKAFTTRKVNEIMESRFGHKEFPGNLPKALDRLVYWGYLEKVKAGQRWDYRVRTPVDKAKKRGLVTLA